MNFINKEVIRAKAANRQLVVAEEKLARTADDLIEFFTENIDLFETKDIHSACVRLENLLQAMVRLVENGKLGLRDPEILEQSLNDLSGFRKALEVNM